MASTSGAARLLLAASATRRATRHVRRRANDVVCGGLEQPPARPGEPVPWLKDATTYSDTHTVVLDPNTKLPYAEKELSDMMGRSADEAVKEHYKKLYSKRRVVSEISFDHIPIEKQIFLLFPGQGSQFVGMGKKVAECKPARALFTRASELLGYDLFVLCTSGLKTTLDQTLYCQPAVMVASLAAFEAFKEKEPAAVDNCTHAAGFSVGEYSALVAAGVLHFDDAVRIVAERARAMHDASQLIRSGMLTVQVRAASRLDDAMRLAREKAMELGEFAVCEVASLLYCGVKVVGASETCMQFLEENANTFHYTVVKRLAVSGAFHTRQMESAAERLAEAFKDVEMHRPVMNVYSNFTGQVHSAKKSHLRGSLVRQLTNPVKWEQIQQLLYRKHQNFVFPRFIEVGPGRQLGAMFRPVSKKAFERYESFPS